MVTLSGEAYVPDAGEITGEFAASVYDPAVVPLCEMPLPAAIARKVVVVESVTLQGLEQEGDDVVGNPVVE